MNKLETLQQEELGFNYIKSYPILRKLFKAQLQISVLELILSYTTNNRNFFMTYDGIADILSSKEQSIRNTIKTLSKAGYITTLNTKNYSTSTGKGGSSTTIDVNIDLIISTIKSLDTNTTPIKEIVTTQETSTDTEVEKDISTLPTPEDVLEPVTTKEIKPLPMSITDMVNRKSKNQYNRKPKEQY
jgi:predicted transcriptional regulator